MSDYEQVEIGEPVQWFRDGIEKNGAVAAQVLKVDTGSRIDLSAWVDKVGPEERMSVLHMDHPDCQDECRRRRGEMVGGWRRLPKDAAQASDHATLVKAVTAKIMSEVDQIVQVALDAQVQPTAKGPAKTKTASK